MVNIHKLFLFHVLDTVVSEAKKIFDNMTAYIFIRNKAVALKVYKV